MVPFYSNEPWFYYTSFFAWLYLITLVGIYVPCLVKNIKRN